MAKKITAILAFVFIFSGFLFAVFFPSPVWAGPDEMLWGGYMSDIQTETGLGNRDPREILAETMRVLLGFMGIIAVMIIILAGFKWMTAYGDEEKVGAAKGMITSGAVGLIIVLFSFGLSQFVINSLYSATGAIGG